MCRRELEVERMRHREEEGELRQSHQQQLLVQQQEFEKQKKVEDCLQRHLEP